MNQPDVGVGDPAVTTPVERVAEAITRADGSDGLEEDRYRRLAQAAIDALSPTIRQEHDAADYLQQRLLSAGIDEAGIGWCTDIVRGLLPILCPNLLTPREAARALTRLSEELDLYDGEDEA